MLIISKTDDFFDDGMRAVVYKNDRNHLYGWFTDKGVELYKPHYTTVKEMYINHKTYDKICTLYDKDARIRRLFDFILVEKVTLDDYCNDFIYVLQYTDDDLM